MWRSGRVVLAQPVDEEHALRLVQVETMWCDLLKYAFVAAWVVIAPAGAILAGYAQQSLIDSYGWGGVLSLPIPGPVRLTPISSRTTYVLVRGVPDYRIRCDQCRHHRHVWQADRVTQFEGPPNHGLQPTVGARSRCLLCSTQQLRAAGG